MKIESKQLSAQPTTLTAEAERAHWRRGWWRSAIVHVCGEAMIHRKHRAELFERQVVLHRDTLGSALLRLLDHACHEEVAGGRTMELERKVCEAAIRIGLRARKLYQTTRSTSDRWLATGDDIGNVRDATGC